jgi:hypothetical protein
MKSTTSKEDLSTQALPVQQMACAMPETDRRGHVNLCCCYIMEADGSLRDPCYHPVELCCP